MVPPPVVGNAVTGVELELTLSVPRRSAWGKDFHNEIWRPLDAPIGDEALSPAEHDEEIGLEHGGLAQDEVHRSL